MNGTVLSLHHRTTIPQPFKKDSRRRYLYNDVNLLASSYILSNSRDACCEYLNLSTSSSSSSSIRALMNVLGVLALLAQLFLLLFLGVFYRDTVYGDTCSATRPVSLVDWSRAPPGHPAAWSRSRCLSALQAVVPLHWLHWPSIRGTPNTSLPLKNHPLHRGPLDCAYSAVC